MLIERLSLRKQRRPRPVIAVLPTAVQARQMVNYWTWFFLMFCYSLHGPLSPCPVDCLELLPNTFLSFHVCLIFNTDGTSRTNRSALCTAAKANVKAVQIFKIGFRCSKVFIHAIQKRFSCNGAELQSLPSSASLKSESCLAFCFPSTEFASGFNGYN